MSYTNSSNELNVKLCRSTADQDELEDEDKNLLKPFNPSFTYPIFGTDELIYGYKNLNFTLEMSSSSLKSCLKLSYDEKKDNADIIYDKIKEFIPLEPESDFDKVIEHEAANFKPPGELVGCYSKSSAKSENKGKGKRRKVENATGSVSVENGDVTYEIFKSTFDTPGWKEFNKNMEILNLFFIEAANYLEYDENWTFYTLFEKRSRDYGNFTYHFVGYSSIYSFYHYPIGRRFRLSQFFIIPNYRLQHHASEFYSKIRDDILSRQEVIELGVEDPSEAFDVLRDTNDLRWLNDKQILNNKVPTDIDAKWIESERKNLKIAKRQFTRLVEMLLLHKLDPKNTEQYKRFRLMVKERLYRFNIDALKVMDVEERKETLQATFESVVADYFGLLAKSRI